MTPHELMTKIEKEGKYGYFLEITFSSGNKYSFYKVLEHSDNWIKVETEYEKEPRDDLGTPVDRCDHFINFSQIQSMEALNNNRYS